MYIDKINIIDKKMNEITKIKQEKINKITDINKYT